MRVDHTIGAKDHLTGRYFFDRFYNAGFLDLTNYPAQSSNAIIDSNNFMINETHRLHAELPERFPSQRNPRGFVAGAGSPAASTPPN